MSDELERQLKAFGATLESSTGEPISKDTVVAVPSPSGSSPRWWAFAGAAACLLAVVAGLLVLTGRDAEAPTAQPPVPTPTSTSTIVPMSTIDHELLRSAPIGELADGCEPSDVLLTGEHDETGPTTDAAFAIAYATIVDHTPLEVEMLPVDGWVEVAGDPVTVRFLDRGRGIEAIVRIRHDNDEWRVAEIAQCLRGRIPSVIQTTTIPPTIPISAETVPDDPLALQRDGWTLVQRSTEPFTMTGDDIPCPSATLGTEYDGADQVHDIMTPPEGTGLDLDVYVLDVGEPPRGDGLATSIVAIGRCLAEFEGIDVESGAMSSIRASWFRAGPDFALVAVVGDGSRSIVLEIEGAAFDDDLIGELAHRADQFLRGTAATGAVNVLAVTAGSRVGEPQVEPGPGQVKLWVGNQSFEDDPVAITVEIDGTQVVDDSFEVGSQHNWFSFMIDGLAPGEHTVTATSDTDVVFESTFTLPPDEQRWMVVDYWYYTDDELGRHFTFRESDEPIYFA